MSAPLRTSCCFAAAGPGGPRTPAPKTASPSRAFVIRGRGPAWSWGSLGSPLFCVRSLALGSILRSRHLLTAARGRRTPASQATGAAARFAVARAAAPGDVAVAAIDGSGPRVAFVIGGPGSGKGTQCEYIARNFGFKHLSAGELLRQERQREGSPLREVIEDVIVNGGTVPSIVIAQLLEQAMRERGWSDSSFIVDGYPRSVEQLDGWEQTLSKEVRFLFCLDLEVDQEMMLQRLLVRAETSGRMDDNEETIKKRFATFEAETGPLLKHFESKGMLRRVNGGRGIEEVWADVQVLFEEALR